GTDDGARRARHIRSFSCPISNCLRRTCQVHCPYTIRRTATTVSGCCVQHVVHKDQIAGVGVRRHESHRLHHNVVSCLKAELMNHSITRESEGGTDALTATATASWSCSAGSRCTWVHACRRSSDWRGSSSCRASANQIRETFIRFANLCNSSGDAISTTTPAGRFRRSKAHRPGGGCS